MKISIFPQIVLLLVLCSAFAHSQQTTSSKQFLPAKFEKHFEGTFQKQALSDILKILMDKYGIQAVVDGIPSKKQADFNFQGTVALAINDIANTFDCEWNLSKSGIVLLRRRCQSPDELPQMHLSEMQQMATDIYKSIRLVPFDTQFGHQYEPINNLIASLTVDQRQALLSGAHIKGSDLQPAQQALLEQGLLTQTFNLLLPTWEETRAKLAGLPLSHIEARQQNPDPKAPNRLLIHVTKEKGGLTYTSIIQNIRVKVVGGNSGQ